MWKRSGSGKPQQRATAKCGPSFGERPERQAAADRSMCSRLLSSGSQVRVLPGASSGGRFEAECLPPQRRTSRSEKVLWKRFGSTHHDGGGGRTPPAPRGRPSASRVPTPMRWPLARPRAHAGGAGDAETRLTIIAELRPGDSPERFVARADAALYREKDQPGSTHA